MLKISNDDFEVNFEIDFTNYSQSISLSESDERLQEISSEINELDVRLRNNNDRMDELNKEIKRLTNEADFIDYSVAVASGVLNGLIDSFWVGEFNFKRGKAWSNKSVNEFVMKVAKSKGYSGERLDGAIKFLEDKFPLPSDNLYKGANIGINTRSHHLDDLAHHPTPIGLFFSILMQFTKKGFFQNSDGNFFSIDIDESGKELIGKDVPSKIFAGSFNWFLHLVSDISGSNKTAGVGMGIPGPIVSLLKELSLIPGAKNLDLAKKVKDVFVKEKFDLRSELAVIHELGRQSVPIILNEVIVRTFYFIRRLIMELKIKKSLNNVDWKITLPWKNRTIVRMLTIATSTFTLIDIADAAIRGGIKSGGNPAIFAKEFILRVNFVGIGRFAIAVASDVSMGLKKEKLRNDRIAIYNQQLHLLNAKIFYKQAELWIAAESTEKAISETLILMKKVVYYYIKSYEENMQSIKNIGDYRDGINKNNPTLIEETLNILNEGKRNGK